MGGGGNQAFITIHPSTMTLLSVTVSRVEVLEGGDGAVVTNAFHSYNAYWYMHALNNNGNEHSR